jgi:gamma-glutamylputrescine oxidase
LGTGTTWESPRAPLPPLLGEVRADACVVGLGGAGLAAMAAALARGLSVVGIDAREPGAGAAGRNGGFLIAGLASFHHEAVARFGRTRAAALYRATAGELDRLAVAHPAIVRRTGSLRIAGDDRERHDCDAQLAAMRDDGLPAHRYDGDEGAGLLFPDDAAYDPLALCRAEADAVARAGGALFGQAPTEAIAPGFVQCATGSVRSRITLVCVDGGIETALPRLAGEARTARLQMLGTGPVAERRFPRRA